jgi:hypothetical protein
VIVDHFDSEANALERAGDLIVGERDTGSIGPGR